MAERLTDTARTSGRSRETADRAAARARASAEWADLRSRLATVTPRGLARAGLTVTVAAGAAWLAVASWPALLPFAVGAVLAYALLPVVDALDGIMPRGVAALVSVLAVVAALALIAAAIVPPLTSALVQTARDLPSSGEIRTALDRFSASLGPADQGGRAAGVVLGALAARAEEVLATLPQRIDEIVSAVVGGLLAALGALVGLVVLPTWMLTVMSEKRRAQVAVNREITPSLRSDAWAVAAIVDRATGAYLRGYVVVAALIGALTWVGLRLAPEFGVSSFGQPLALAALAGTAQLIPAIGGILGLLPALLIAPVAPDRAVAFTAAYVVARYLGGTLLGSRIRDRQLGVHPAILVPGIVVIGQFGLLPLLLSAPLVAIAVDLVRYAHGRLSDPPMPVGWIPGTAPARAPVVRAAALRPMLAPMPAPLRPSAAGSARPGPTGSIAAAATRGR